MNCPVRRYNVCEPLGPDRQRELYEHQQTWKRGQYLYREGYPVGPILKIITGIVSVSKTLPDGRRQILDFFFAGELCGYLETEGRYTFEGQAITDVTTCAFTRSRFKAFTAAHDDLTEIVRATLAWKLEGISRHAVVLGQLSAKERVATFLCWFGARSGERGGTPSVRLPMARGDIADYLGLTIETVSRTLSKLRMLGIIEVSDTTITVLDAARLASLASPLDEH